MEPGRVAAGSLGPRLAGRLTAELILRSPQYMNCVKEYEIDLRGLSATVDASYEWQTVTPSHLDKFTWGEKCVPQRGRETHLEIHLAAGSKINSIENLGATQVSCQSSKLPSACFVLLLQGLTMLLSCRTNSTAYTCQTTM